MELPDGQLGAAGGTEGLSACWMVRGKNGQSKGGSGGGPRTAGGTLGVEGARRPGDVTRGGDKMTRDSGPGTRGGGAKERMRMGNEFVPGTGGAPEDGRAPAELGPAAAEGTRGSRGATAKWGPE